MAGGGGGGSPIQTLTTQDGTIVPPTGNNINVSGGSSTVNNINGITTVGDIPSSTVTVNLTNRITGTATTTDAATTTLLLSFPLGAVAGTYNFNIKVNAYNLTDSTSAIYNIDYGARTTGAAGVTFGLYDVFFNEEGTMSGVNVGVSVVVVANTLTVRVNGLLGKTIHWVGLAEYIFVS